MTKAQVSGIILGASLVFAFGVVWGETLWSRTRNLLRAKARGLPFAGRTKVKSAAPSLVAPEAGRAIRNFRVPWLTRTFHRSEVFARGVLTVERAGRRCRLTWTPERKSRRRGAKGWQLEREDIDRMQEFVSVFGKDDFFVKLVDGAVLWLTTASLSRLRRALADTGIVFEPTGKRTNAAKIDAYRSEFRRDWKEDARQRVRSIPPFVTLRKRTWDDVAEYLSTTAPEAWNILKDEPPEELARLGLSGEAPPAPVDPWLAYDNGIYREDRGVPGRAP